MAESNIPGGAGVGGKKIEAHVDSASCYKIEGWAWCPNTPSEKLRVALLSADGARLAELPANRRRKDLQDLSIGDGHYGFVFYGLMKSVAKIVFTAEGAATEEPLEIEPPPIPDYLADNDAYRAFVEQCGFYLIHPDDYLFRFNIGRASLERCVHDYISAGVAISSMLKDLCVEYSKGRPTPLDLLDFASGFGRVSRCLDSSYFNVTASDIHDEAMRFIETQNPGIKTLLSQTKPQDFTSDSSFDVIFALSFFTHMPHATYGDWVEALYKMLRPGGLLVFTAHGRVANAGARIPLTDGYGFVPASEQKDLDSADYGQTISELPYVVKVLHDRIGQYPVLFQEGAEIGSGNQDLYIVRKEVPKSTSFEEDDSLISRATLEAALEEQRKAFYSSSSWKVTKPLRAIKALFGRREQ